MKKYVIIFALFLFGCASQRAANDQPIVSKEMAYLEFEERPSIATTPVYKITVMANDSFFLIPEEYIKYKKAVHGTLPNGSFLKISNIVERFGLKGKSTTHRGRTYYDENRVNCPSFYTDSPGANLSLVDGDNETYITVDWGCTGYEEYEKMMQLFEDIKLAIDVKNFIYPDYTTEYWKKTMKPRIFIAFIFIIVGIALLSSCSGVKLLNTITPSSAYKLSKNLPYSEGARHMLDIYAPDAPKADAPVVMFIHGGSWDSGDKNMYKFIGEAFASEGYTTVIPNYRLYPEAKYPAFVNDTAAAIAFTAKRFDRPVIVISHSAGAYNAVMASVDPKYLSEQDAEMCKTIAGTVGMAGPYGAFPLKKEPYITMFPNKHMGDDAPVPLKNQSPTPPLFLPIGDKDTTVSDLHSRDLAKKIEARGGKADFKLYTGLNHTDMAKVLSRYFDQDSTLKADIVAFIKANSVRRENYCR